MANEQQQTQPQVAIPLPKGKKNAVQIGCICMMLSVAMYGLVFATLTSPILESVNAMGYVSLFSIFAGMGVSIMTPIGGKLGDLIGRRNIVVIPGIICAVCGIAFAFVRSLVPLMILRLLIGFNSNRCRRIRWKYYRRYPDRYGTFKSCNPYAGSTTYSWSSIDWYEYAKC